MKYLHYISYALIIIGALNWGIYGLFGVDLVGGLFGGMNTAAARTIYTIVGLSAIVHLVLEYTVCRMNTKCYTT